MTVFSIRAGQASSRERQELTVVEVLEQALFGGHAISTKLLAEFILNDLEDIAAEEASLANSVTGIAVKPRIRVAAITAP